MSLGGHRTSYATLLSVDCIKTLFVVFGEANIASDLLWNSNECRIFPTGPVNQRRMMLPLRREGVLLNLVDSESNYDYPGRFS